MTDSTSLSSRDQHSFGYDDEHFLLDGKSFQIISGEIHYPRVPRDYWQDRLRKIRSLGCNAVCIYSFWDLHEPEPGVFNFDGNLDVASFIEMSEEEGLWVLFRPGPYICADWDFGGLPSWLLTFADMKVRTLDPQFLKASERYFHELGRRLSHLQITRRGPIIMVQVENEYGEFGRDNGYLQTIESMIRDSGFDTTLFTCNEYYPGIGAAGTLPDAVSAVNFGEVTDPEEAFALFEKEHGKRGPLMTSEYWAGWFDHWGEPRKTSNAKVCAERLDWMLSHGISVNMYVAHGGTTFGFMAGANFETKYRPIASTYDFNAPLDEAGRPKEKFSLIRNVISKYRSLKLPPLPEQLPMIEIPTFALDESASLDSLLRNPVLSDKPLCMEALGQSYGFVLYRTTLSQKSASSGRLEIKDLHDYAILMQKGKILGTIDRRLNQTSLEITLDNYSSLDILVENMGRICYGSRISDDKKGITERVTLQGEELTGWEMFRLPMTDLSPLVFGHKQVNVPTFFRGQFELDSLGDTFLDMRGWGKGCAWVNGNNLGRYWHIGPQQSLFVPAPWLKKGENEVIILDLEDRPAERSLKSWKDQIWANEN